MLVGGSGSVDRSGLVGGSGSVVGLGFVNGGLVFFFKSRLVIMISRLI